MPLASTDRDPRRRTVLVTGATGFVAQSLVPRLAERFATVRCLLRRAGDADAVAPLCPPARFEPCPGDLEDAASLRRAVADAEGPVDAVVHLGALVSFAAGDRARSFRVNRDGTAALAAAAREAGVARFLHVSSIAAIACSDRPQVLDETAVYNFGALAIPYSDSKHAAEQAVLAEVQRGLAAVIVNPSSMFGPGDRRKGEGSLLEAMWRRRVPFCPPGGCNFTDVRDVAAGCAEALVRGRIGERYVLGGDNLTGRELLQTVGRVLGVPAPRRTLPRWAALALAAGAAVCEKVHPLRPPLTAQILRLAPRYTWFSSAKAERELGYAHRPVEHAIRDACDELFARGVLRR